MTSIHSDYLLLTKSPSIVFSFWRQSLDVVGQMFDHHGIEFCRVDGHLAPAQRQDVLKEFQQKSSIRVLIMTIGTGAVGYVCSLALAMGNRT